MLKYRSKYMNSDTDKRIQILYLEDDSDQLPDTEKIKNEFNADIHFVTNYTSALEIIDKISVGLFILDIEIKNERCSGIQLAETIRQNSKYITTPVIFISMHTHFSGILLSKIKNCVFLPKPIDGANLIQQIGINLGLAKYINTYYSTPPLLFPSLKGCFVEVDSKNICYISVNRRDLLVQCISGETFTIKNQTGYFKKLLMQIHDNKIDFLRQIYRSVIININQISHIETDKNVGYVYLFGDDTPQPLGIKYRENVSEFIR